MCRELSTRLASLSAKPNAALAALPSFEETSTNIEGREVTFQTITGRIPDESLIVVVRAFAKSWSRPNWIGLSGTGYMFADGFLAKADENKVDAPDELMWEFR
jgi:hypothetical protein